MNTSPAFGRNPLAALVLGPNLFPIQIGPKTLPGGFWEPCEPTAFNSPKKVVKNQTNFYSTKKFGAMVAGRGFGLGAQPTGIKRDKKGLFKERRVRYRIPKICQALMEGLLRPVRHRSCSGFHNSD